ncbi:MAG TPA: sigma-70 family RNA polymerase sigma factor [Pirellulales bacterium]|nr:sigma-70 family RNA polymerase sigma factor [Pirellulales bacterium]
MSDAGSCDARWSSTSATGTSRSLVARVRGNDPAGWKRLVALYGPMLDHWCRRWQLPAEDIADLAQEVFQSVAAHIASYRHETQRDTFRGWLRTIALNKVRDHFRRQGREPRAVGGSEALERLAQWPDDEPPHETCATDDRSAEQQLFRRALETIRDEFEPRTWRAFWQTAVEHRAATDVAADLAMSPGAVRVAKSRVLQRLRAELGDV